MGEIYDEDDDEDFEFSEDSITLQEDGTFLIRGDADLDDCDTILRLNLQEDEGLKEFSTISGFLCMCAGEIPSVGDFIMSRGWSFEILKADDKKILLVKVERLVGAFEAEAEEDVENNLLAKIMKNKKSKDLSPDVAVIEQIEEEVKGELKEIVAANIAEAKEVERMVEASERKMQLLEAIREGQISSRERDDEI